VSFSDAKLDCMNPRYKVELAIQTLTARLTETFTANTSIFY
jgi:hypothetical protein